MGRLTVENIFKIAVELEQRGFNFFTDWAEKAESDEVKMFFSMLADEEKEHIDVFLNIAKKQESGNIKSEINEKFMEFFDDFQENVMFSDKEFRNAKTLNEAFELAKKQEIDVQLFYSELKKYVDRATSHILDDIIAEEQLHYKKISDLQKKLNFG